MQSLFLASKKMATSIVDTMDLGRTLLPLAPVVIALHAPAI